MPILISGSLAYDSIMDFSGSFKSHILPEQIHTLNVSFAVSGLQKNFGGTAGNIAYNIKLLGGEPLVLAPLGEDGREYLSRFRKMGIKTEGMPILLGNFTASAYIITDKNDNQISAFHAGAASEAHKLSIGDIEGKMDLVIVGATKKEAMIRHARECHEQKIPLVFDPGQQITSFTGDELRAAIKQAKFYIVNDYEMKLTAEKTGWDENELLNRVEALIITNGEKGSVIKTKKQTLEIKPCRARSVEDPTGAGDAYRAGFFYAYLRGMDLKECGQVASVAAVYAVERYGTQNHSYAINEFLKRYEECYNTKLEWK